MSPPTRPLYAADTKVPVERSRREITGILATHGVERMGWTTGPEGDDLLFELNGRRYRLSIRKPTTSDVMRLFPNHRDTDAKLAQEWRRRWRANVLLIKAKLEFADGDLSSPERELMPYLLTAEGNVLGDLIENGAFDRFLAIGDGR